MQEVQDVCDRVIIINKGKLVADDKTENLQNILNNEILIEVEFEKTIQVDELQQIQQVHLIDKLSDTSFILHGKNSMQLRKDIFAFAVSKNNALLTLKQENKSLEDIFQQLTNKPS